MQAGRLINVFCVYYRALLTGAPPGPGDTGHERNGYATTLAGSRQGSVDNGHM